MLELTERTTLWDGAPATNSDMNATTGCRPLIRAEREGSAVGAAPRVGDVLADAQGTDQFLPDRVAVGGVFRPEVHGDEGQDVVRLGCPDRCPAPAGEEMAGARLPLFVLVDPTASRSRRSPGWAARRG